MSDREDASTRDPSALDALAAGDLDAEDVAFLRALADGDEAAEAAVAAHRPLGAAFQDATAERILRAQRKERRARWRRPALIAMPLAAAAAIFLALWTPSAEGELVGGYSLAVSSAAEVRGEEPEVAVARFEPTTRVELSLRPASAIEGELAGRAYLVRGAEIMPLQITLSVAPSGALRGSGVASAVFGDAAPGPGELAVVVVRGALDEASVRERVASRAPEVRFTAIELVAERGR